MDTSVFFAFLPLLLHGPSLFLLCFAQKWNKIWRKQQFSLLFNFLSTKRWASFHPSQLFFSCFGMYHEILATQIFCCHCIPLTPTSSSSSRSNISVIVICFIFFRRTSQKHTHTRTLFFVVLYIYLLKLVRTLNAYDNHNFERFNDGENEQFCMHLIIMISNFLFVDVAVDFYPYFFVNF